MSEFSGKQYFIIGASGGVGQALCARLNEHGAKLFLLGRDETKLKPVAKQFNANYAIAQASDFTELEQAANQAIASMGQFDGLVNCAGSLLLKSAANTSEQELNVLLKANFYSAFSLIRQAPKLIRKEGGAIVLISSVAARLGLPNHEAIASVKAAVQGLMLSAAASYAKHNIRVNTIAPGLVETPMTESLLQNDLMRKASEAMHPLGRIGKAEHIAEGILFLLNPSNDWMTGEVISIDGGMAHIRSANRG